MKTLIVEDDFISRIMIQRILSPYGECHIAVNGVEAIEAFLLAWVEGHRYDLICVKSPIPGTDGLEVLKRIRAREKSEGIIPGTGVKVIVMTSPVDKKPRFAPSGHCDACLVKPIDEAKMIDYLSELGLVQQKGGAHIRTSHGIIPICSYCKGIRDDKGVWHMVEKYLTQISDILLSHGICPECMKKYYLDADDPDGVFQGN
jgi:two-component system, chemotaxis family, chemotaxis protein CheY